MITGIDQGITKGQSLGLKGIELETKSANKLSVGRLKDPVNLEREKIRMNGATSPAGETPEETL